MLTILLAIVLFIGISGIALALSSPEIWARLLSWRVLNAGAESVEIDAESTIKRWLLAIALFIGVSGAALIFSKDVVFFASILSAATALISCRHSLPDWSPYMVFYVQTPVILGALAAAGLVVARVRWYWALASIGAGVILSIVLFTALTQLKDFCRKSTRFSLIFKPNSRN